jgi:hypothetical protein
MRLPTYEDLTVRQFQEIVAIQTSDMEETDKIIQSICTLTGMSEREVEELPIPTFNQIGYNLAKIFTEELPDSTPKRYLRINGRLYGVNYNPRNLAFYQYTDIQAWINAGTIANMHKVVASLVYPVKKYGFLYFKGKNQVEQHAEISEGVLDCKYMDVHAICVFFSLLWSNSIKALASSLAESEKEMMTKEQRQQMKELLEAAGDGFITRNK